MPELAAVMPSRPLGPCTTLDMETSCSQIRAVARCGRGRAGGATYFYTLLRMRESITRDGEERVRLNWCSQRLRGVRSDSRAVFWPQLRYCPRSKMPIAGKRKRQMRG